MKTTEIDSGAGIRSRLSNVVQIKVFHYCKIINIIFIGQKRDFHAHSQYCSRAVSPYGTFIVCTDHLVQAAWQQYRPIVPVSSAETASYKPRRV